MGSSKEMGCIGFLSYHTAVPGDKTFSTQKLESNELRMKDDPEASGRIEEIKL